MDDSLATRNVAHSCNNRSRQIGLSPTPASTVSNADTITQTVNAAHKIQRAYKRYRLRKVIAQLRHTESWFFDWTRFSDDQRLKADRLLAKSTSTAVVSRITELMYLLGFPREAADCKAKIMLMAFLLNHHGKEGKVDTVMMKRIQNLGCSFKKVCESPTCWFTRIRFLDAFATYYQYFLSVRRHEKVSLLPQLLSKMADLFSTWSTLAKGLDNGHIKPSNCQRTLNHIQDRMKNTMNALCCLTESQECAAKLVRLEVAKRQFLQKLGREERTSCQKDDDKNRQYRCVGMQLAADSSVCGVYIDSREARYDGDDACSVTRTQYHLKLAYIKQLVRTNYGINQELWVPSFINHVRLVLNMVDRKFHVDDECVAQQCSFNNYNVGNLVKRIVAVFKDVCSDTDVNKQLSNVEQSFQREGATKEVLFRLLDRLDDLRVNQMDKFFRCNSRKLVSIAKHNELRFFIEDLRAHRFTLQNLLTWALESEKDCKCLVSPGTWGQGLSTRAQRLNKLKLFFGYYMTAFPSCSHLKELPETFQLLRLLVLRTLISVRDLVLGFSILHFSMGLSQDRSKSWRLKKSIMQILASDATVPQSEIVNKICAAVLVERPCMSPNEQKLLWAFVTRIIRRPANNFEDNALGEIPRLAWTRLRIAVQRHLLMIDDTNGPVQMEEPLGLRMFENEVDAVCKTAAKIWTTSVSIYGPVYETLVSFDDLWINGAYDTKPKHQQQRNEETINSLLFNSKGGEGSAQNGGDKMQVD